MGNSVRSREKVSSVMFASVEKAVIGPPPDRPMFSNTYLRRLIVPLILEQALSISVGLADTMMIANVGEAAISGVSLIDNINHLTISILMALATGGAVVCSQFLGAKRQKDACRSANQLFYTSAFAGLLIMALCIGFRVPLIRLFFGQIDADVMKNCLIYFTITAASFPFISVYAADSALFRSMGNSAVTLRVSILMNILNVSGNAIGIYVLKMGVAGVAWPSLISRAAAAVILTVLLRDQDRLIHFEREPFHIDFRSVRRILYIGIPSGIESGLFQFGKLMVASIISTFGTVQIAASGAAYSIGEVGLTVGEGITLATITVVGQCVGAGDEFQVRYYTKKLIFLNYLGSACIVIPLLIFLDPVLSLFGLGAETTAVARSVVRLYSTASLFLWPLSFVLPNMLRACNDVRYTMTISIISMFAFRYFFSIVFGVWLGFGVLGTRMAMLLDWLFRIACFVRRYRRGKWRYTMHMR